MSGYGPRIDTSKAFPRPGKFGKTKSTNSVSKESSSSKTDEPKHSPKGATPKPAPHTVESGELAFEIKLSSSSWSWKKIIIAATIALFLFRRNLFWKLTKFFVIMVLGHFFFSILYLKNVWNCQGIEPRDVSHDDGSDGEYDFIPEADQKPGEIADQANHGNKRVSELPILKAFGCSFILRTSSTPQDGLIDKAVQSVVTATVKIACWVGGQLVRILGSGISDPEHWPTVEVEGVINGEEEEEEAPRAN